MKLEYSNNGCLIRKAYGLDIKEVGQKDYERFGEFLQKRMPEMKEFEDYPAKVSVSIEILDKERVETEGYILEEPHPEDIESEE
ncbi:MULTISPECIES: hypothetical protein [Clostridium]|uniref:Uncharacterized protein n=1 Tax=Clostridium lapidicellarium TaxID=3240931 RepID=A0ABV4DVZ8_9CLOT